MAVAERQGQRQKESAVPVGQGQAQRSEEVAAEVAKLQKQKLLPTHLGTENKGESSYREVASKEKGTPAIFPISRRSGSSLEELKSDAASIPTAELRAELTRLLSYTAENLLLLAVIVAELEHRGENLSGIRIGLLPLLRLIATGQLHPEIVVMYAGEPLVLKRITKLPISEQLKIVNGGSVPPSPKAAPKIGRVTSGRSRQRDKDDDDEDDDWQGEGRPANLTGIARNGTPRDVADMILELILQARDKKAVVGIVVRKLVAEGFEADLLTQLGRSQHSIMAAIS